MKLSIITINYNNATGLKKTIASIVNQSLNDFEYIIIDGNSTDESRAIIKENQGFITDWISEPDNGVYNAMNKGFRKAKGEYILFLNSGDTLRPNANLHSIVEQLSGEDIIYFDLEICDTINNNSFVKTYPDYIDFKYMVEDGLPHMGSFIKRELLLKYGVYNENMKIASDWAFFIDAICLHNCKYKHVDGCFSTFYLDGMSSNSSNRNILIEEREIHIAQSFPLYNSIYKDWLNKKQELYNLKTSSSVRFLKKIGLLKWLKL
ncbi:glycosyltransferase family 2 protein [Prevotella sp. 10(H)]|uniref:glycosyltransferase family 2 protein n=1 Tax=Prevotella sp. 10(H) TaxID=1158294 RepID=UPI0004A76566|nr:glycosyltransferase family 2 protein [Prevotella sp. 10(H)]